MERQSSRAKGPNYVNTRQRPSSPSRKALLQLVMVPGWMAWQDGLQTLSSACLHCIPGRGLLVFHLPASCA